MTPTVLEICAGGGGMVLGLEQAGFDHTAAVEIDPNACATLRHNRSQLRILQDDVRNVDGRQYRGVDVVAGGVPCPPFSVAGKQLGANDERDLFPEALRLVEQSQPRAVVLENVPGLATPRFTPYRQEVAGTLSRLGYTYINWRILNACDYGVPQLRPRLILVALREDGFQWPCPQSARMTVGSTIGGIMASRSWSGAAHWYEGADRIAPTIVGGSKKHGGPDLGPTRARRQWKELGVNGISIADLPPGVDFPLYGLPRLTLDMVARLQGFPDSWQFCGGKTAAYRQIGNALPPPLAKAVGESIIRRLAQ